MLDRDMVKGLKRLQKTSILLIFKDEFIDAGNFA
jgi:hypothetical protein